MRLAVSKATNVPRPGCGGHSSIRPVQHGMGEASIGSCHLARRRLFPNSENGF